MKVVINGCFGGFGLSPLATKRIAELQGRECHFFVNDRDAAGSLVGLDAMHEVSLEEAEKSFMWFAYDTADRSLTRSSENWHDLPLEERQKDNERISSHSLYHDNFERNDPLLVQVVEELGDAASGKCAKLEIVEIPDGISYEIEEYDGNEHIAETHRTWR